MEPHFAASREELYHVQMDVKHVQAIQTNHADRLLRLEKRQADDAALKSVWNSPFPSVMGGTPQQGPVHNSSTEGFGDFEDEQSQNLLGSLHLDADEEPVRRGASRANSVRFDVSAIHGSSWAQGSRYSGEFAPVRPNSGIGGHPMTERSLSHKSDGRHSSAGHSIHSAISGRTSSLGLDTNFLIGGQGDDSPLDIPEPPPGLFILGTVPSIIRCWLNQNFSHSALLYAVVSTGSQRSQLDYTLVKQLGMRDQMQNNGSGSYSIRLPVYLPEAIITQPSSRANSPAPQLPTLTATFEVLNVGQPSTPERKSSIRVFLGSDTLRAHSADLLLSRNLMTLYGDDKNKVSVPFVRPEDDNLFRHLCTTSVAPEKVELKATAPEFTPTGHKTKDSPPPGQAESVGTAQISESGEIQRSGTSISPNSNSSHTRSDDRRAIIPESTIHGVSPPGKQCAVPLEELTDRLVSNIHNESQDSILGNNPLSFEATSTSPERHESTGSIWGSWRTGPIPKDEGEGIRENTSAGYQRASRGGRSMKVLKPFKSSQSARSTSGARTGVAYEAPSQRLSGESRRRSQGGAAEVHPGVRWEFNRTMSDEKVAPKELRPITNVARSSNPIGGASAFAWMNPGKPMGTQTSGD